MCNWYIDVDLWEMEVSNMVRILERLQYRYLELLSERLVDQEKDEYTKAVFDMRNKEVSETRLIQSQEIVMRIVEKYGRLMLVGDQLTVCI